MNSKCIFIIRIYVGGEYMYVLPLPTLSPGPVAPLAGGQHPRRWVPSCPLARPPTAVPLNSLHRASIIISSQYESYTDISSLLYLSAHHVVHQMVLVVAMVSSVGVAWACVHMHSALHLRVSAGDSRHMFEYAWAAGSIN
jgi:hypothetical protein